MPKNLPKIALFFAGGASVQTEGKSIVSVQKPEDTKIWLESVPELGLIAELEGFFVFPDGKEIEPKDWNTLAEKINENFNSFDGFVVLHGVDSMLYSSAALSFIFSNLTKPIVFTGSPLTPDIHSQEEISGFISDYRTLGVRANLINAIQVATMSIPEVMILFGNQVLRANRARKSLSTSFNVFEADEQDVLGSVDFGIRLKEVPEKRKGKTKLQPVAHDANVSVVRIHPSYAPEEFADVIKEKPDVVLLHTYLQKAIKQNLEAYVRICEQQEIPLVVFNPFFAGSVHAKGLHPVTGMTYEAFYAKIFWALGFGEGTKKFIDLISTNVSGELVLERRTQV